MTDNPALPKMRAKKEHNGPRVPKPAVPAKPLPVRMDRPDTSDLARVAGSKRDVFNTQLIDATTRTLWDPPGLTDEHREQRYAAMVLTMMAFKPADEIEAMLVAQAMAQHHAAMECSRRAMLLDQPFEFAQGFRKAAANASRTFTELLAALDRKRGKGGQQRVVVEHVHVHPGGQAIVGTITSGDRGGGGATEADGEPREPPARLAHDTAAGAGVPSLLCADSQRDGVPGAGDAEPTVLPARRGKHRANGSGN